MAGRRGGGDDGDVVFDENFVKGAAFTEDDWRARKRASQRRQRKDRRAQRRREIGRRARRVVWYAVAVALVVVLLGVGGHGPLGFMKRSSKSTSTAQSIAAKRSKNAKAGSTTTTIFRVTGRSYKMGDCVVFDDQSELGAHVSRVVGCDRPHNMEMTASLDLTGRFDHFPTELEWKALYDHDCGPSIRALLGAPLDPDGRFAASGIQPLADGWAAGERTLWCSVSSVPITRPPNGVDRVLFTGKAEGTSQARLFPTGSCASSDSSYVVSCSQAHEWEVSGYFDLTAKTASPPAPNDIDGWRNLVGDGCGTVARAYLGHDPINDEGAGWQPIQPGSWAAGQRQVECTVARYHGGQVVPMIGSLKT